MDSDFKGLWWLTNRSIDSFFKSQKSLKKRHSKKVSWVALLATTTKDAAY